MNMKLTIEQKIGFGFSLALASLLIIGALFYRSASRSVETARWVEHTERVLDELHQTLIAALNVETRGRGFALTGDGELLKLYYKGVDGLHEHAREVRSLTADNPGQQKALDSLEPLITQDIALGSRLLEKAQGAPSENEPQRAVARVQSRWLF